jgi:hypothetical protein
MSKEEWIDAQEILIGQLCEEIEKREGVFRDPTDAEIDAYCTEDRIRDLISSWADEAELNEKVRRNYG